MTSTAAAFLVALVVSALATPLVRRLSLERGWVEGSTSRLKVHREGLPRLGGIAVVLGFFAPLVGLFVLDADVTWFLKQDLGRFAALVLGSLAIFALGLWDDLRGLAATPKFLVQSAVALGAWWAGLRIDVLNLPGLGTVDLGPFGWVVTVLWLVGITNALNLVDGLDGLAAGVAFFAGLSHLVIGALNGSPLLMLFSAALCGSVLGFLPYNLNPARIFIGDCGSLFLGFLLAATSIYGATSAHGASFKSSTAVAVLGPILIFGLPILDTLLAMARRTLRGRSPFDGDKEHVHHVLLDLGLSPRRSVLLLWTLCAAFALAGLVATATSSLDTAVVLVSLLLVLVIFERRLGLLRRTRGLRRDLESERLLALATTLARDLELAQDPDTAWSALTAAAEELEVYRMSLRPLSPARPAGREWRHPGLTGRPREGCHAFTTELHLGDERWALEMEKRPFHRNSAVADGLFAALLEGRETARLESGRSSTAGRPEAAGTSAAGGASRRGEGG